MFFGKKNKKFNKLKNADCTAVIAAAGDSLRMGGVDKQLALIHGVPVLAHTLKAFQASGFVREIVVVTREDNLERVSEICKEYGIKKASHVIKGGSTRLESVIAGVFAVSKKSNLIAIHDGARPCVTTELIDGIIKLACEKKAVVPVVPVTSTIKLVEKSAITKTISREGLYDAQTPQVFSSDTIKAALTYAFKNSVEITDDSMAVEALGLTVYTTNGAVDNIKITTPGDIISASAVLLREADGK